MTWLEEVIHRVREHDAARPRSVQPEIGWSELGGCRSALGYRLTGEWPSDEPDMWAASRGTALHEYLEPIIASDGVRTEVHTSYRGVPGHADLVGRDWVGDLKSKTRAASEVWRRDPAAMNQARIQVNGYCAGLIDAGELPAVSTIRILVVVIDGVYSDWWCVEEPFDRSLADEGIRRLEEARTARAAGRQPPKDKPYFWCRDYCPWFSLCRSGDDEAGLEKITDPELAGAVAAYGEANATWSAAGKAKKQLAPLIRGLRGSTGEWRIAYGEPGEPTWELDEEWVRADYAARGEELPLIRKPGSAPRMTVTQVKKKAATS